MSLFRNRRIKAYALALGTLGTGVAVPAYAQYPGHIDTNKSANTPTLRATAVVEYTGDLTKPIASRLVPVAVWDGERYQPGGLYMAQPMPLAVESGTQYVLEDAGLPKGLFNVKAAADVSGSWIAIGAYQNMPTPRAPKLKASKTLPQFTRDSGADDDKPHFAHRPTDSSSSPNSSSGSSSSNSSGSNSSGSTSSSGSAQKNGSSTSSGSSSGNASTTDSDRPTLHRRTDDSSSSSSGDSSTPSSGSSTASSNAPPVDPDRPTLHRPADTSNTSGSNTSGSSTSGGNTAGKSNGSGSGSSNSSSAEADPERPTLHHHTANPNDNGAPVSATTEIDPDRPRLMRGRPEELETIDDPDKVISAQGAKLDGSNVQFKQVVGVSDVKTREPHSFVYSWSDPQDATKMQAQMENLAQNILAGNGAKLTLPAPSTATTPAPAAPKKTSATVTNRRTAHKTPPPPALPDLTDEHFKAYELSFGGGATLVFSAKTKVGDATKYVTLIAQPDFDGTPQVILKQVTDDTELDITPRMQLVDAVDTDADNRAELIFELAGKRDHQYAIYRVADRTVNQVFTTGSSQD